MSLDQKMQKIPQNNASESNTTIKISDQCSPHLLKPFNLNIQQSNTPILQTNGNTQTLIEADLAGKQNLATLQEELPQEVTQDQIENNDPNLIGRRHQVASQQIANNQVQTNGPQTNILKLLLQQQDHSKQYSRFGSVGKSANQTNLNLLQTHQEPIVQSRNQQGKHNTNTKNFRKIYKMHQSMQKKERSVACELQVQSRIKMPQNAQPAQSQPSQTFQTIGADFQYQPQYKLLHPQTVTNMAVTANCANFQSAQTSVRNKKFQDQVLQVKDQQLNESLSTRNYIHARMKAGQNLIEDTNQLIPTTSPQADSQATILPRSSIQQTKSSSTMMAGSATGLNSMQFEPYNQPQSVVNNSASIQSQAPASINQVKQQNLTMHSNQMATNAREDLFQTSSQVMDCNQENIVKITNLDLGDSTLENEEKSMSHCGPITTFKTNASKPQPQVSPLNISEPYQQSHVVQQSPSSNSLERDSNSFGSGLRSNSSLLADKVESSKQNEGQGKGVMNHQNAQREITKFQVNIMREKFQISDHQNDSQIKQSSAPQHMTIAETNQKEGPNETVFHDNQKQQQVMISQRGQNKNIENSSNLWKIYNVNQHLENSKRKNDQQLYQLNMLYQNSNSQNKKQHYGFSSEEDEKHDCDGSDKQGKIETKIKRNNSTTFNSMSKRKYNKNVFNSGVKASIDGRQVRAIPIASTNQTQVPSKQNNNEQTSSSLGKRNFGSYQKVQQEQKEQRRLQRIDREKQEGSRGSESTHNANQTQDQNYQKHAYSGIAVNQQQTGRCPSPAIIKQSSPSKHQQSNQLSKQKSQMYDLELMRESGQKLIKICDDNQGKSDGISPNRQQLPNQDGHPDQFDDNDSDLFEDNCKDTQQQPVFIGNGLAVPYLNVQSDIFMSSSCGDRTPGADTNSFNNFNTNQQAANIGNQPIFLGRQGSEVNFQNMGHNGQCKLNAEGNNDKNAENLLLRRQFTSISGYENISDNNQNPQALNFEGLQRNRSISPQLQNGQLERQMQNSGSTIDEVQNQIQHKLAAQTTRVDQINSEVKKKHNEDDQDCYETEEKQKFTPMGKNTPNFPKKGGNKITFKNNFDMSTIDKNVEGINAEGPSPSKLFQDYQDQSNSLNQPANQFIDSLGNYQLTQFHSDLPVPQLFEQGLMQFIPTCAQPNQQSFKRIPNCQVPFISNTVSQKNCMAGSRFTVFAKDIQPLQNQVQQHLVQSQPQTSKEQTDQQIQDCNQIYFQNGEGTNGLVDQMNGGCAQIQQHSSEFQIPKEQRRSVSAFGYASQQQRQDQIIIQNNVRRQLSFRSVSNTSSNIETPMQHKRMKLRDVDSSGQMQKGHKNGMYRATFLNSSSCLQNSRKVDNQVYVINSSESQIEQMTPSVIYKDNPTQVNNFTIFSQKKAQKQNFLQKPSVQNSNVAQKLYFTNAENMSSFNEHQSQQCMKETVIPTKPLMIQKQQTVPDKDIDGSHKSLYQKWISANPVFNNKYSSGATPARKSRGSNRNGISQIRPLTNDSQFEHLKIKKSQSAIMKTEPDIGKVVNPSVFYDVPMNAASKNPEEDEDEFSKSQVVGNGQTEIQQVANSEHYLSAIDDDQNPLLFQKTLPKNQFRAAGSIPDPMMKSKSTCQIDVDYIAAQNNNMLKTVQVKNQKGPQIIDAQPEPHRYSSPNLVKEIQRTSSEIFENTPFKKPVSGDVFINCQVLDGQTNENQIMANSSGEICLTQLNANRDRNYLNQSNQIVTKRSHPNLHEQKDSKNLLSKGSNMINCNNEAAIRESFPFQNAYKPQLEQIIPQYNYNNINNNNQSHGNHPGMVPQATTPNMASNPLIIYKTHSSISNLSQSRHSQGLQNQGNRYQRPGQPPQISISIKQNSVTQDGKSNGGPKTPVNNPGNFFKVNSVSITNTSMNDQSVISSSLDTEGAGGLGYRITKKRRPKPSNRFSNNQFQNLPAQALFKQQIVGDVNIHQNFELPQIKKFNSNFSDQQAIQIQLQNSLSQPRIISPFQPDESFGIQSNSYQVASQPDFQRAFEKYENTNYQFLNQQKNVQTQQIVVQPKQTTPQKSWFEKEFEVIEVIGKGHFGRVMRCQNKTDKFEYAIKVTNTRIRNPNEKEQYLQEMQTLSALSVGADCPHIVRYFNSWIEDERIHIVMELCDKSLRQIKHEAKVNRRRHAKQSATNHTNTSESNIKNNKPCLDHNGLIPEDQLRQIIRDILLGLDEVHSQDIVHLDIKPENILQGKSGKFKLADLGMSRLLTKITDPHTLPEGDCRYLARELLSREVLQNLPDLKKSDIFSLGITAYELITLENLEKNGKEWQDLREGNAEFMDEATNYYSQELLETVKKMLSPNTDQRPGANELLQTVFISKEERRIRAVEQENQMYKEKLQKIQQYLEATHGINIQQILQNPFTDKSFNNSFQK